MLLYDLATANELNFGNVSDFSFDKKGNWLAWIVDANDKAGNGVQVMNVATGSILPLDSSKAVYRGLNWTEKGDALATLRGVDDKAWEDKLYSVVAFRFGGSGAPEKIVYDPSKDSSFPKEMSIASSRNAAWNNDLSAITFGIHELKKKEAPAGRPGAPAPGAGENNSEETAAAAPPRPDDAPKPDLVIWHWKDSRLQSMQYIQEAADKNYSYAALYRPAEKKFVRLADESLRQVNVGPYAKFGIGFDVRDYELESNLDGQRYEDVYKVDLSTGAHSVLLKKAQWVNAPSPDASHLLYYEDGSFFTIDLASGQKYNITKGVPSSFINTEDDHNIVKPPAPVVGWSSDSAYVLLSDEWDIWRIPAHGGTAVNLTANGKKDKIRYRQRYRLDPEERGIDLAQPQYFSAYGEWNKKSGFVRIEPNQPPKTLRWEDASFGGLIKARRADVYAYTRETNVQYPNYRVSGAALEDSPAITDANPQQKDFLWTKGMRLVDYTSVKGDKLQGALYLPANYEAGKSYPTIVYIYEKLSQGANTYPHPTFNGFNTAVYTSNGYAVFTPDIVYKVNDPGMSAVWCLEPALKAAIGTGVVDEKRVGLHGHSWGGYQTAFTITQSKMFRAAIAGAPLTDMVSMYSSIYWNSGSANQPIFESSQGRFTSSYSENPEAYVRNSPVYHAKNVNTPLIILHNDKDGAVDFTQGIEYYNTLRRLGKQVVMLQYKGENHGLRKPENMKDYTIRMKEFFDYQLMAKEPPKWWLEGVPYLKMKDHLDERDKQAPKPPTGAGAAMK
jgi:dipeptidyl aminopeptidase/acylaminoacyl peptidase